MRNLSAPPPLRVYLESRIMNARTLSKPKSWSLSPEWIKAAVYTLGMTPAINPANGPPLQFYVQAGAYARPDDADAQRARVAMLGMAARVMAREQAGRTVYRVRVGPFDERSSAEDSQARLGAAGIEANLVRVER